jgi:rare lipoprotein A (peptidoglycan hydrolase)
MYKISINTMLIAAAMAFSSPAPAGGLVADREGPAILTASWYGQAYGGRRTASGEPFDPTAFTAAHSALPFGTLVEVWEPDAMRRVTVRVNDRPGRPGVIDLSEAAARALGIKGRGLATVIVVAVPEQLLAEAR